MTKVEEELYNTIFTNGNILSHTLDSCDFHAMTHQDTEILGAFCDFSGIHGEDLKKLLIRGYLKGIPKAEVLGNWRRVLLRNEKGGCVGARMICPVCNADNGHDEYMKHCPNCGARLDKNIGNRGEEFPVNIEDEIEKYGKTLEFMRKLGI